MSFVYQRTVRFHETDAAGVVYFANILILCHEAYEASLEAANVDLKDFFAARALAFPIIHTAADFKRPIVCGERLNIELTPAQTGEDAFEVSYQLYRAEPEGNSRALALALTRHVCIDTTHHQRHSLPSYLVNWLQQWQTSSSSIQ